MALAKSVKGPAERYGSHPIGHGGNAPPKCHFHLELGTKTFPRYPKGFQGFFHVHTWPLHRGSSLLSPEFPWGTGRNLGMHRKPPILFPSELPPTPFPCPPSHPPPSPRPRGHSGSSPGTGYGVAGFPGGVGPVPGRRPEHCGQPCDLIM